MVWPMCGLCARARTFFEDTAIYLLKEDCHKGKGARRYSTSRNLTPPAEPVRLRLGEEEEAEVPPGVKIIEHVQNANEFGRYEVMVGRIYNQAAFSAWWSAQRRKAAPIRGNGCAGDGKAKV